MTVGWLLSCNSPGKRQGRGLWGLQLHIGTLSPYHPFSSFSISQPHFTSWEGCTPQARDPVQLQVSSQGLVSAWLWRTEPHSREPQDRSCSIRATGVTLFPILLSICGDRQSHNLTKTTRIICLKHNMNMSLQVFLPQSPKIKM